MTGIVFGKDEREVQRKVHKRTHGRRSPDELRQKGAVVGTAVEVVDQLQRLADSGVQRVMLQWLDLDDLESLEAIAKEVLPRLAG
jgi:alkanesulfonate monooxygenase SsuD/methylene tetrahydromethanopterin reductase-like flavin-dependent oxidoreductase (luciferase family)